MILGIVGHEAKKFTPRTETLARDTIRSVIEKYHPDLVVSGACHLGGIDIWAIEEAKALGIETKEYKPRFLRWGPYGYKDRNLKIADSDHVLCVVVAELPDGYDGMRFGTCYHCGDLNVQHVKSGGCWTALKCKSRQWAVIK